MPERKICVVTGSRAEYGLLRWLLQDIKDDSRLVLQIVVTGMHLAPQFGSTWREIVADGFSIVARVDTQLVGDSPSAITKSVGIGVIGFAETLERLRPDLMVILGDRFEILAAAQAALLARVPIAHIHGGELTEGAIDDSIRHAITKMSHLHFTAAEPYRRRVIQMGESPDRVFTVGALGVDNLKRAKLLNRLDLETAISMKLKSPSFLVTYHPETLAEQGRSDGATALLDALDAFQESTIVFTMPNADTGARAIAEAVDRYVAARPGRTMVCTSLGQQRYLSAMTNVDAVIGNSSSGIIEAPAAGVPSINIGDRQKGRLRSQSVIDCEPDPIAITKAIRQALTFEFRNVAKKVTPAYGSGGAARRICEILATHSSDLLRRKVFYDVV